MPGFAYTVLPNLSHNKVSLSLRVRTHPSRTLCPRDTSSKGRIVQETYHPRDALSKERNIRDFSFGDTPVGDEITLHCVEYKGMEIMRRVFV
jgi:hypothetical protein